MWRPTPAALGDPVRVSWSAASSSRRSDGSAGSSLDRSTPPCLPSRMREGERAPRQRLEVGVGQQPGDELLVKAELGRIPVDPGEGGHRVEQRVKRLPDGGVARARASGRTSGSRRRPRAASRSGRRPTAAPCAAASSSMKFCTLAGDIRSGRPLSWSQPKSMIRSAQRLAACRSDSSSASSEARNSAASSARRSVVHGRLGRGAAAGRRGQRPDTGPDERVPGREGVADRRVLRVVGGGERGLRASSSPAAGRSP